MSSEPQKETTPEDQERSEREATFSRRGLLQWSVPAILAVTLPGQVSAGSMGHNDVHRDHLDFHMDDHQDGHQDAHEDSHKDSHGDQPHPFNPGAGKGSGQVPNFSATKPAGEGSSGAVPKYNAPSIPAAPGQGGGSGTVPKYNPPTRK